MMIVEQTHEEFDVNNTGRHKDKDINRQFLVTATSAENDNTTSNNQNNLLSSKDTFSKSVIDTKCMPTKPPLIRVTKKESPIKDQNGETISKKNRQYAEKIFKKQQKLYQEYLEKLGKYKK